MGLTEEMLLKNYETYCDPRMNYDQVRVQGGSRTCRGAEECVGNALKAFAVADHSSR